MRTRSRIEIETAAPGLAESHADAPIEERSMAALITSPRAPRDGEESRALWRATVDAIWPWSKKLYRGYSVTAGEALGYASASIRRWRGRSAPVSHAASLRIIALLETRIAVLSELLTHWRRYAADRAVIEAQTTPGFKFRSFSATERDGWRSKPRTPRSPRS